MSAQILMYVAILVFVLMVVGLVLSMREFVRVSDEPSKKKGVNPD